MTAGDPNPGPGKARWVQILSNFSGTLELVARVYGAYAQEGKSALPPNLVRLIGLIIMISPCNYTELIGSSLACSHKILP